MPVMDGIALALNERGEIWIVEIKSSVEDLRADQKWHEYRAHCDRLFFAFTQDLPCEIFPEDTGLIIADAYGAHLHCEAPEHKLAAATSAKPSRCGTPVDVANAVAIAVAVAVVVVVAAVDVVAVADAFRDPGPHP